MFLLVSFLLILIGNVFFASEKTGDPKPVSSPVSSEAPPESSLVKVIKVYDGDTIEVIEEKASGPNGPMARRVRYIGIDSAEVYPSKGCYSEEAKKANENLVLENEVKLVMDVSKTDKYGRLLSYVYVGDKFVNDELVRAGFAKVMTIPPDVKYKDQLLASEKYARDNNLGLWSVCK